MVGNGLGPGGKYLELGLNLLEIRKCVAKMKAPMRERHGRISIFLRVIFT